MNINIIDIGSTGALKVGTDLESTREVRFLRA